MAAAPLSDHSSAKTDSENACSVDRSREDCRRRRLNSELITAVFDGNLAEVVIKLKSGASVNATCRHTFTTALQLAVACGHVDIANYLLDHGADPRLRDLEGRQAVHMAAASNSPLLLQHIVSGDPALVNSQVTSGSQGNENTDFLDSWSHNHDFITNKMPVQSKGATPLHLATQRLHLDCVIVLLIKGASAEIPDERALTPFDVVGEETRSFPSDDTTPSVALEIVTLLASVTDIKSKTKETRREPPIITCLHTAVERQDLQLIKYLLNDEENHFTTNESGLTPLHLAITKRYEKCLSVMLDSNNRELVNVRDKYGVTLLHLCVAEEWFLGVSLLLEAGADVKLTLSNNETVLHIAARKQGCQLLEELLAIPESLEIIDFPNDDLETPLWCAVSSERLANVKLLLSRGADVTTCLYGGESLLHQAAETGNKAILEILVQDPRVESFKNSCTDEVKNGINPLHIAAVKGFLDCVEVLIAEECDLVAATTDRPYFQATALHLAAWKGHYNVVECIVSHDKNKNTLFKKDQHGQHPLHVAARFAHVECVRYMLLNGANLAALTEFPGNKQTALEIIFYNIPHVVNILQEIFDSYIADNGYPLNDPKCVLAVNYTLLQPHGPYNEPLQVLESLLKCDKLLKPERLLMHPLVETYLFLKWEDLKHPSSLVLLSYLVFILFLTKLALNDVDEITRRLRSTLSVQLIVVTALDVIHVWIIRWRNVIDMEVWIKLAKFLLLSLLWTGSHTETTLVSIVAVAVLLSWIDIMFLISHMPGPVGLYFLMFFTVIKKVAVVLIAFAFIILGFTFSFMIYFEKKKKPFDDCWTAFVRTLTMSLEFDYNDLFDDVKGNDFSSFVGRSMFLLFMVMVAIGMINLLVGLAVSDISTLKKQGRAEQLAKQIDFLKFLDFFYRRLFLRCPNKASRRHFAYMKPIIRIEFGKKVKSRVSEFVINSIKKHIIKKRLDKSC